MGKEFGDLGQGTRRWWCTDDGHRVGPGVPVERVSQHGLVSVYMCVRGCGCLSFRFPVSTGDLQSGDTDSWHICARRAGMFSLLPRTVQAARGHPLSLCPEKAILFPNGNHIMLLFVRTGYITHKGKAFERMSWTCLRKKSEKSETVFYFFRTIVVQH